MTRFFTDYRLWLWQARFLAVVAVMESVSGRDFTAIFIAAAMSYGLAAYFMERP